MSTENKNKIDDVVMIHQYEKVDNNYYMARVEYRDGSHNRIHLTAKGFNDLQTRIERPKGCPCCGSMNVANDWDGCSEFVCPDCGWHDGAPIDCGDKET